MKKNNPLQNILFSTLGVAAMLIVLIAVNFIVAPIRTARLDLTEDKLYTLSEGSRSVLKKLEDPVRLRLYASQSSTELPAFLKAYMQQVEDLLAEYKQAAPRGRLIIEKLDPVPDSDAEDQANLDGIQGQMLPSGDRVYLGLTISCLEEKVALPVLTPDRDRLLEYDITRAIARVTTAKKPVVGVMSSLQVMGMPMNPMMRMGGRGNDPWVIISELKQDFTVREIPTTSESIDADVNVLLVIHPKSLSETTQYAIDQFLLRGGKLIALLDPYSALEQQGSMMMRGPSGGSNLEKLLPAWGIQYDPSKVVADPTFKVRVRGPNGQPEENPTWLLLKGGAISGDDVTTAQIDSFLMAWAGAFTGEPAEGLRKTVLLKTTAQAKLIDSFMATLPAKSLEKDLLTPDNKEYALALRLAGKFKTAFPAGKPAAAEKEEDEESDEPGGAKPPAPAAEPGLKESTAEGAVVLIADVDFIHDNYSTRQENMFGQRILIPQFGNLTFAQSLVELMAGDTSLVEMRSRASATRPFVKIREMQSKAEERLRTRIQELETKAQEAQRRIQEIQNTQNQGQRFLTPEQMEELRKMQAARVEANKELKQARKELRRRVESLETRLKWINIAAMPLVVALSGLVLALYKRKLTAAK